MGFNTEPIFGVEHLEGAPFEDERGLFVKVFQASRIFSGTSRHEVAEIFWSESKCDVIRGMHYQKQKKGSLGQSKIVSVARGRILDVILDARPESPSFGQVEVREMSGENGDSLYIPSGVAHGFRVMSASAITLYSVSTEHDPNLEAGFRYDSFGFIWPGEESPILSTRDLALPSFSELDLDLSFRK